MGQVILETSRIPRTDIFSFTAAGKLFIVQNWGAEVLLYLVYLGGGFPLLIFVNTLLLVLTLVPIYILCRKWSTNTGIAVFSACIVVACIPGNLRPQNFSFLLFSIFMWILLSSRPDRQRRIWFLPLLMILWANLHGAFVIGLILISIYLLSESLRFFMHEGGDTLQPKQLALLLINLIVSILCTLINPEGSRIYDYIRTVMNDPSSQQLVAEWQPPIIDSLQGFILFYMPFFLLTCTLIFSEKRPNLTEVILYGTFSTLGIAAGRNSVWFLIISAPLMARYLPFVDVRRIFALPHPNRHSFLPNFAGNESYFLNHTIALAFLTIAAFQSPWSRESSNPGSMLEKATPVAAMDFIETNRLEGNIYHTQIYGDYLIWRLWPNKRSFFDGRVHLFGESFVEEYCQIREDSHWEQLLEKYKIRYLLLSKYPLDHSEIRMIGEARRFGWKILFEDRYSILFERAGL